MLMELKITNDELIQEIVGKKREFPKYVTQLLNLANQNAQGTRPRVVGQLTDLIQECPEKTYEGWKAWHLKRRPKGIKDASEKITAMVENLKKAITQIDVNMIKDWTEMLVLEQTFIGLRFQEAILKKIAKHYKTNYRLALSSEEKQGIDGFVGETPLSIKPSTYKIKKALREEIQATIVFYEKTKTGIEVQWNERDFK